MPLNNPTAYGALMNSGTYVGDATANKAIAHGLSKTPKLVIIVRVGGQEFFSLQPNSAAIFYQSEDLGGSIDTTAADGTSFYVGSAVSYGLTANLNAASYPWVAIT